MKKMLIVAAISLCMAASASADIARPDNPANVASQGKSTSKTPKPKGIVTQMDIRLDSDATEATLSIPRSQIKQLRAQLEELDNAEDNTAAAAGLSRTQTAVSGMFLSLALVFGGMWFVRSGKAATKTAKTIVTLITVGLIASAATFVYANAGPPSEARTINGKMFSSAVHMYGFGWGEVRVVTSTDDHIRLVVPNPKPAATPASE